MTDANADADSSAIRPRLVALLRRDLKLGDEPIEMAMPLAGSDLDLDSLDILMLVTSIEREFGLKIPNDQLNEEMFKTVGSLAEAIEQRLEAG